MITHGGDLDNAGMGAVGVDDEGAMGDAGEWVTWIMRMTWVTCGWVLRMSWVTWAIWLTMGDEGDTGDMGNTGDTGNTGYYG